MKVFVDQAQKCLLWPRYDEKGIPINTTRIPIEIRNYQGYPTAFIDLRDCSQALRNDISLKYEEWVPALKSINVAQVCFRENSLPVENLRAYAVDIVDLQGCSMKSAIKEFDLFQKLYELQRSPNDHVSIISMLTDEAIWTTNSKTPYQGITFLDWRRRNHQAHIPDQLNLYKNQLLWYGQQKTDASEIDFTRPHLSAFSYQALWLRDLQTKLSICVDAWLCEMEGEPVRITRHVRPPEFID